MNAKQQSEKASNLWQHGQFSAAAAIYHHLVQENPQNKEGVLHLGELALWQNQFVEAERWLQQAAKLAPKVSQSKSFLAKLFYRLAPKASHPKSLLAELFYRQDQFPKAAALFREIGRKSQASKLESFIGQRPYQLESSADIVHIPFLQTDPLPLLAAHVNGHPANFLLDTGASELIISPELAEKVGAARFGAEAATFAGGKQANYEHGRIDTLSLGDWTVHQLPIHILDTSRFTAVTDGIPVDGIIGTVLLYHFLATIDYPQNQLVLQRTKKEAKASPQAIHIPFWLVGDHYMVAWGTVNQCQPMLMIVDTGLAGGGFLCPESTLEAGNIQLSEEGAFTGIGGSGQVTAVPFAIEQLTLGEATAQNVTGIYGPFPPSLEHGFGFRIGGLISHGFFRNFALTFDFRTMKLSLE